MHQNELDVRKALRSLRDLRAAALTQLGKDPAEDAGVAEADKALAVPGGASADFRHLMVAADEVANCLKSIAAVAIKGLSEHTIGEIGDPVIGLRKAALRLSYIGTGKPFDYGALSEEDKLTLGIKPVPGAGETPKTRSE